MKNWLRQWLMSSVPVVATEEKKKKAIHWMAHPRAKVQNAYTLPKPAPFVLPAGAETMAMDSDLSTAYSFASQSTLGDGLGFLGYPYLAELAQRPEYRMICSTIAEEMTRKWIKITGTGDEDKTDRIHELNEAMEKYNVRALFCKAAEVDGFFGRVQIYVDTGHGDDPAELMLPLIMDKAKIKTIKGFRVIEPFWTYPGFYTSVDPLSESFYKPRTWYVMGKEIHTSRLLTIVGHEMPDILKPAYSFGGLSMAQMAKPYVDNWIRTRQSVSDLIHSFSVLGLSTDLESTLNEGDADELQTRTELFNNYRDNRNLMVLNKATEELFNVSTPLGTLDKLQAQAQEHLASVSGIPLVKLLGITPSGLNASTDGEMRAFYDRISARQRKLFTKPLKTVIELLQLMLWGEIDPHITWIFQAMEEMNDTEKSTLRKTNADTDAVYIGQGVVSPEDVRTRIAAEEDGLYQGLDPDDLPQAPDGDPDGQPADVPTDPDGQPTPGDLEGDQRKVLPFAQDAEFKEDGHKRDKGGKFSKSASMKTALHPDNFASDVTKKFLTKTHSKVDTALAQSDKVAHLTSVKTGTHEKYGKVHAYLDQLIKEHGAETPKAEAPKISAKSQELQANIMTHFDKVLPANKPAIKEKMDAIKAALHSSDPVGELKKIESIKNPQGMGQTKTNELIKSSKIDLKIEEENQFKDKIEKNLDLLSSKDASLVKTQMSKIDEAIKSPNPKDELDKIYPLENVYPQMQNVVNQHLEAEQKKVGLTPKLSALNAKQEEIAKKIKSSPPKKIHQETEATTTGGQPIKVILKADSSSVKGDFYPTIMAKLEGNNDHGPHVVAPLDGIMNKYSEQTYSELSEDEKYSLHAYQNGSYSSINSTLKEIPPNPMPHNGSIGHIKKAMKTSVVPADLPVWRGINADLKDITGFGDPEKAIGQAFVHKNFASVSRNRDKSVAFSGGQTLLKFTLPAGAPGVVMKNQEYEREILMDSHSMFRIDKVEKGSGGVKTVLHVTYLGQQEGL